MTQHINLLVSKRNESLFAWVALALLGGLVLLLLGVWFVRQQDVAVLEEAVALSARQLQASRDELQAKSPVDDANMSADTLAAELAAIRPRADAAQKVLGLVKDMGSQKGYARHFHALASISEEGLWLTGVTVNKAGKSVSLTGQALRRELVMRYVQRLNSIFADEGVQFTAVELTPVAYGKQGDSNSLHSAVKFKLY